MQLSYERSHKYRNYVFLHFDESHLLGAHYSKVHMCYTLDSTHSCFNVFLELGFPRN